MLLLPQLAPSGQPTIDTLVDTNGDGPGSRAAAIQDAWCISVGNDEEVTGEHEDLVELFDHVWDRFWHRMDGLGSEEWSWLPTDDRRIGLRWRLGHIRRLLSEERNAIWLGRDAALAPSPDQRPATAAQALADVYAAYRSWRELLSGLGEGLGLDEPLGDVAGSFASASRRSFVLHIADELIHHAAEAALLRDLFADRDHE